MMRALIALLFLIAPASARDLTVPDPVLTPGVASDLTTEQICNKSWHTKDVRSVSTPMKRERFTAYGITCRPIHGEAKNLPRCGNWEIDHLISLELAGANVAKNLWPQKYTGPWNARLKDKLENRLHKEICAGNVSLEDAQKDISTDWREPYRRYFGEPKGK